MSAVLTRRDGPFGQTPRSPPVDRFGVWLSARRGAAAREPRRTRASATSAAAIDASFARSLLDDARSAVLVDVALADDLKRHPKVTAIEGRLPEALADVETGPRRRRSASRCSSTSRSRGAALRELRRVTAPGGVCLINVPTWRGKRVLEFSAFRLGVSPPEEMDDHKRYYDPRDLWPLLVEAGFLPERHPVPPAQVRPQHVRRLPRPARSGRDLLRRDVPARRRRGSSAELDRGRVERVGARRSPQVRDGGGRLFVLGVGGSAGHACHAVNDFRKLCGLEAYAPTDNVVRADRADQRRRLGRPRFAAWLEGSRARRDGTPCSSSPSAAASAERGVSREPRAGARHGARGRRDGLRRSSAATAATRARSPTRASSSRS